MQPYPNGAKVLSDPNTTPHLAVRDGIRFGQSLILIENVCMDFIDCCYSTLHHTTVRRQAMRKSESRTFLLLFHFRNTSRSFFFGCRLNVEDIVASDQDFAQETGKLTVDELFTSSQLHIHVSVCTLKFSLVFHSPLELDLHKLTREIGKKGSRIDNELRLRNEKITKCVRGALR
jgi:hypothetical protein